jgi:gamma-glutamyl-gamma-aminobutyrate hydrolase PuuD
MDRKKIALLSLRDEVDSRGNHYDSLEEGFQRYFESLNYLIVPVSNRCVDVASYFTLNPDLVLLSGGNDSTDRDIVEKALIDGAIEGSIPVLGICHGFQFLNQYFGGSVETVNGHTPATSPFHPVDISYKDIDGNFSVNTYHNDGFREDRLGKGLEIFATASDGIIEGFYHKDKPILGVQWHPERDVNSESYEISKKLVMSFLGDL